VTGPTYNSTQMESGRNLMRGCRTTAWTCPSRATSAGRNRALEFRLDVYNLFDTVIYTGRNASIQY
jgi:hypothetical protein